MPPKTKKILPYILVLLCGVIWGVTFSLARIATEGDAHPIGLSFWQAAGGGMVLLLICLLRGRWSVINRRMMGQMCIVAILGTAIPGTLFYYAAAQVPAGILAITVSLVPILTYAFSWALRIDRYHHKRFAGIVFGFVAVLLLVVPESSLPDVGMIRWLLLALLATVFYTVENLYIDMYIPQGTDLIMLLMGGLFIAGIALIPVVYMQDAFVPIRWPFGSTEWAITGMAVVSSIAYAIFLYIVKMSGAVFASMTGYVITLTGVLWGMLIFSETHSLWVWSALVLMLLGMALVTPREDGATEQVSQD